MIVLVMGCSYTFMYLQYLQYLGYLDFMRFLWVVAFLPYTGELSEDLVWSVCVDPAIFTLTSLTVPLK